MVAPKRAAEAHVRDGLTLTKDLHKRLREWEQQQEVTDGVVVDYKELKTMVADTNKLLVKIRRQIAIDDNATAARDRVMLQAIKDELIDRDANAARVSERMRVMADRTADGQTLINRSNEAAQQIIASIEELCPWQMKLSQSVPMLAQVDNGQ